MRVLFFFCIVLLQTFPVLADDDCLLDNIADCVQNGSWEMKLKRLYDIDMGQWSGQAILDGSTQPATDGRRFCILAYRPQGGGRIVRDYNIDVTGPFEDSSYVLRQGSKSLPVTLTLKGQKSANSYIDDSLANGTVSVDGINSESQCKNYEFSIIAEVSSTEILNRTAVGRYQSTFALVAYSTEGFSQTVTEDFVVTLDVIPVYQVNQLQDVVLDENKITPENRVYEDLDFCVFAMGAIQYKMSLRSQVRPSSSFELQSGGDSIPYRARVELDDGTWNDFTQAGSTSVGTLTGSGVLNCGGSPNSRIRIDFPKPQLDGLTAGTYTDTMEVTVEPE
ncbi:hypothetical protein [Parendozoicomonas sp. Alg238-R29]|uniref:hypothetical protein n=1 Tax=Parendozoicomonas sp. Alg238-R29 TaxID=2993446 RepID=UPI00248D6046|nr:hypothetical protein [Parendozoicomonas sp. Alg238-R29]